MVFLYIVVPPILQEFLRNHICHGDVRNTNASTIQWTWVSNVMLFPSVQLTVRLSVIILCEYLYYTNSNGLCNLMRILATTTQTVTIYSVLPPDIT